MFVCLVYPFYVASDPNPMLTFPSSRPPFMDGSVVMSQFDQSTKHINRNGRNCVREGSVEQVSKN